MSAAAAVSLGTDLTLVKLYNDGRLSFESPVPIKMLSKFLTKSITKPLVCYFMLLTFEQFFYTSSGVGQMIQGQTTR